MISKAFSLRNYIMKQLMKTDKSGIMKLPDKGNVDFGEMIIKENLFRRGIDPKTITSESQLDNILNTPHVSPKPKKSGEVIDVDFGNFPEKKAGGGRTGTGLNYLLGEDDQNFRVPFEKGKKVKKGMTRRAFLKTAAGLASLPFVGKFFKVAKLAKPATVTELTRVPIKSGIDGMPAWFKPLVNKVIKEGTEIDSGAERVIVHKAKLPKSKTDVIVEQDLVSGDVRVDLGLEKHGFADGKFGQPVRLEYKASEVIEPPLVKDGKVVGTQKGVKTKEEFWVEEAEFTGGHPENIKFEESSFNKFGKHESDFSEVEMFAKGKPIKTRKISSLQKEGEDLADHFSNYPGPDDFASGGRVPLGKGGVAGILGE